jgi:hypothetical protein
MMVGFEFVSVPKIIWLICMVVCLASPTQKVDLLGPTCEVCSKLSRSGCEVDNRVKIVEKSGLNSRLNRNAQRHEGIPDPLLIVSLVYIQRRCSFDICSTPLAF